MTAVPFQFDELYAGFADCNGLLRNEGDHLCLEYQVQDAIVGMIKSEVKEVRLQLHDMASIELRRKWFGFSAKLVLQLRRMEPVQNVPGMKQGRLTLGIARADRPLAERLVREVNAKLPRVD